MGLFTLTRVWPLLSLAIEWIVNRSMDKKGVVETLLEYFLKAFLGD